MIRMFRRPAVRAGLGLICGCLPGLAGATVVLGNRSGQDVVLTRAGAEPSCALVVEDEGKEPHSQRLLPRPGGPRKDWTAATVAGEFETEPKCWSPRDWKFHYLLRDGQSARLRFESSGRDEQAELVLFNQERQGGLALKGVMGFTVRFRAGGPGAAAEPVAALELRPAAAGCNRDLNPVNAQEIWLEKASRAPAQAPAEPEERVLP